MHSYFESWKLSLELSLKPVWVGCHHRPLEEGVHRRLPLSWFRGMLDECRKGQVGIVAQVAIPEYSYWKPGWMHLTALWSGRVPELPRRTMFEPSSTAQREHIFVNRCMCWHSGSFINWKKNIYKIFSILCSGVCCSFKGSEDWYHFCYIRMQAIDISESSVDKGVTHF